MPEVILTVGGRQYGGWKSVDIRRGIEQIAGSFELSVTERWAGQDQMRPIRQGDDNQLTHRAIHRDRRQPGSAVDREQFRAHLRQRCHRARRRFPTPQRGLRRHKHGLVIQPGSSAQAAQA